MRGKVDTIEKLAQLIAEGFSDVDERFDKVYKRFEGIDQRFDKLEGKVHNGFAEMKIILDRIDTRISALENAVFGISLSASSKNFDPHALMNRLEKLEREVFKNKHTS